MGLFRHSGSVERHFPTAGYLPYPSDKRSLSVYIDRYEMLRRESRASSQLKRVSTAVKADLRVVKGPTPEDLAAIPWLGWGWEWTSKVLPEVGVKPGDLRYGVFVDLMCRMVAAARHCQEDRVPVEEGRRVAGVDPAWILVEHNALPSDVNPLLRALNEHYASSTFVLFDPSGG